MTKLSLIISFIALLTACYNPKPSIETDPEKQNDTTKALKIGAFWATPKPNFELNFIVDSFSDTLKLVTCNEFVYSPFGQIVNKSALRTSNLRNFKSSNRLDKTDVGEIEFQILTLNSSRLILFFDNNPDASKHSYIFKGEINDKNVNFINGIKIGMTKENFIKTFFNHFPKQLMIKYNFIIFESCVQDIEHTYAFKNNKLKSINFITDSYWTVNY